MSASEKLKALAELDASTGIGHIKTCTALRNALPQIVAVVEWAEKFSDTEEFMSWTDDGHPRIAPNLDAALSALEEALS